MLEALWAGGGSEIPLNDIALSNVRRVNRRFICPMCKRKTGVSISYGLPGDEMFEEAERSEIVLGGCMQEIGAPDRQCLNCGHQWEIARRSSRPSA